MITTLRRGATVMALAGALTVATVTPAFAAGPLPPDNQSSVTISGIGATFPAPFFSELFSQFKNLYDGTAGNPKANVSFDYAANGSGAGITAVKTGTADYGATDAPASDADVATASGIGRGALLHIPVTLGGVVLAYNIPGLKTTKGAAYTLKLTGNLAGNIYAGKIKYWDDATIKAANPGAGIPHLAITPVRRSDSSGTTFIFQSYLFKMNGTWRCILGTAGAVKSFPTGAQACLGGKALPGVGAPRNSGVAARVGTTKGAVGYVEYAYALSGGLKMAKLKNLSGIFVAPSTAGFSAAAASATLPADLRGKAIVQAPGANSWPIAGFSYLMVYTQTDFMGSKTKADMYIAYLYYALTSGQNYARSMGYAPLPSSVKAKSLNQLHKLTWSGAKLWP